MAVDEPKEMIDAELDSILDGKFLFYNSLAINDFLYNFLSVIFLSYRLKYFALF